MSDTVSAVGLKVMAEDSNVAGEEEFLDAGVGDIDINKGGLSDETVSGDSAADDSIAEGDDEPIGDDIAAATPGGYPLQLFQLGDTMVEDFQHSHG